MNTSLFGEFADCCGEMHLISKSEQSAEVTAGFIFSEEYLGFSGHFPDRPILPAIVQLAMIRYLSEQTLEVNLIPQQYNRIKFSGMIGPYDKIVAQAKLSRDGESWGCQFAIALHDGSKIASGEISFMDLSDN